MRESLRRVLNVTEATIVGALVPRLPGCGWVLLLKRRGQEGYWRVPEWTVVGPGDEVVAWLLDPGRLDELQRLNSLYSDTWYIREDWYRDAHPWDDELAVFDEWVPARDADVLEICCGAGRTAPTLIREGNRVVGLDLAVPSLVTARKVAPPGLSYVRGDATALPFPDARFDTVLCLENSLGEFLSNPMTPLAEMVRVCRSGGRVIIALREADDPWVSWSPDGFVHVVRTFPPERRDMLLQAAVDVFPRVAQIDVREGQERPWGGVVYHAGLEIS